MAETKQDANGTVIECWYSPKELLEIIQNIQDIRFDENANEVEVLWKDEPTWCVAREYWSGSFTRLLLELFDAHLKRKNVYLAVDDGEL